MTNEQSIIKIRNLRKSYVTAAEKIHVLTGLNMDVEAGEILAISGASGSGKSTLLHIIGQLDEADGGELEYNGKAAPSGEKDLADFRAKTLGFVFQYHHLLPEFNVLENLMLPQFLLSKSSSDAEKRAREMLKIVGLEARAMHHPSQISGGEKQRVAVLRALINHPILVLADEPTGNLDEANTEIIVALFQRLRDEFAQSFIIATHDAFIWEAADRTLTLQGGNLQ